MFFSKSGLVILKVDQGNFEKAQIFPVLLKGGNNRNIKNQEKGNGKIKEICNNKLLCGIPVVFGKPQETH